MDFRKLMEAGCGQSNPISQLVQHVTEDQRFHESIGNASPHGLNQQNLMQPQSFRMNDLMREMERIEQQQVPIPFQSTPYVNVENHSLLGATWTTPYQSQLQESSDNLYKFHEFQNYIQYKYRPNEIKVSPQFESKSEEPRGKLTNVQGMIAIKSLDELEKVQQLEENSITYPKEIKDKQLPEEKNIIETKTIPEFTTPEEFFYIMNDFEEEWKEKKWKRKHPNQIYRKFKRKDILHSKVYSHIENNPMRGQLEPYEKGEEALKKFHHAEAGLYFDEAVRIDNITPINWYKLSFCLYQNNEPDKAISALKQYLKLKPRCYTGICLMFSIYCAYRCEYQACRTAFNWLKNKKSYKHLIPPDFTMDDRKTPKLDENTLNDVKSIFLKAARENPVKVDADLQVMIGNLYNLSDDFDKVTDCRRTAINHSKKVSYSLWYNMGFSLFFGEKLDEALDAFYKLTEDDFYKVLGYEGLAYVYMYMKNFREAIRYFKKALRLESLDDESNFELKENTLEDEFDLCVRMYCTFHNQ